MFSVITWIAGNLMKFHQLQPNFDFNANKHMLAFPYTPSLTIFSHLKITLCFFFNKYLALVDNGYRFQQVKYTVFCDDFACEY